MVHQFVAVFLLLFALFPFTNEAILDEFERERIEQLRLPADHPACHFLDSLFRHSRVTASVTTMTHAGFRFEKLRMGFRVATHSALPDYIFKLYLDDHDIRGTERLIRRAETAYRMRAIIRFYSLHNVAVPETWVYELPEGSENGQEIILVQEFIPLCSIEESEYFWRHEATWEAKMIDDLFTLFYRQSIDDAIPKNIRFTKALNQVAIFDLEYPTHSMRSFHRYMVPRMPEKWRKRWYKLVAKNSVDMEAYD